jgi:glyoxylase-like metal-dependent hydrolase (beta-lactamase superfamily II)
MDNGGMKAQGGNIKKDYFEVAPGVWGMKIVFVNVYMIANPLNGSWVLVDAGLKGSAGSIKSMAEDIFGHGSKPAAIVLTHGHFDHTGALEDLLRDWDVTVYAHPLEGPYLNGSSSYPSPDPTVGGGMMSYLSWLYPRKPINLGSRLHLRTEEQGIPALPEWKIIHTPGHTPGHISLFRESDRVLIAGDAFVTTNQASAFSAVTQRKELNGPPPYFTSDWIAARNSVRRLEALHPEVAATGHGRPMRGIELGTRLHWLALNFEESAVPDHGRYVDQPALADESGVIYVPPQHGMGRLIVAAIGVVALTAGMIVGLVQMVKRKRLLMNLSRAGGRVKETAKAARKKSSAGKLVKGARAVKEKITKAGKGGSVKSVKERKGSR